jgi:hypothetical protein
MSYQYLTDRPVEVLQELRDLVPEVYGLPGEAAARARRWTITCREAETHRP